MKKLSVLSPHELTVLMAKMQSMNKSTYTIGVVMGMAMMWKHVDSSNHTESAVSPGATTSSYPQPTCVTRAHFSSETFRFRGSVYTSATLPTTLLFREVYNKSILSNKRFTSLYAKAHKRTIPIHVG